MLTLNHNWGTYLIKCYFLNLWLVLPLGGASASLNRGWAPKEGETATRAKKFRLSETDWRVWSNPLSCKKFLDTIGRETFQNAGSFDDGPDLRGTRNPDCKLGRSTRLTGLSSLKGSTSPQSNNLKLTKPMMANMRMRRFDR
jgi:hypothetical protein